MIADWSVDAGEDSPQIVVPWEGWIDLRGSAHNDVRVSAFFEVSEAVEYSELIPILRLANEEPTMSSKVDVFEATAEDADPDLAQWGEASLAFGLASYLDLLLPARQLTFAEAEGAARATVKQLRAQGEHAPQSAEIVVRPAVLWGRESWGWSLYAVGFGPTAEQARLAWAHGANAVVEAARAVLCAGNW